jgi:hypothetical protein
MARGICNGEVSLEALTAAPDAKANRTLLLRLVNQGSLIIVTDI